MIYLLILLSLFFPSICLAQERVTISTYYPSAYGIYEALHTGRLFIRQPDQTDPRLAISRGDNMLFINTQGPNPFSRTEIEGQVRIDGGLAVGVLSTEASGNLRVADDAVSNGVLAFEVDVGNNINATNMRIDGNLFFPGGIGITTLVPFTANSGVSQCPMRYYAVMALDNNRAVASYDYGGIHLMPMPQAGFVVCVRHAD